MAAEYGIPGLFLVEGTETVWISGNFLSLCWGARTEVRACAGLDLAVVRGPSSRRIRAAVNEDSDHSRHPQIPEPTICTTGHRRRAGRPHSTPLEEGFCESCSPDLHAIPEILNTRTSPHNELANLCVAAVLCWSMQVMPIQFCAIRFGCGHIGGAIPRPRSVVVLHIQEFV